MTQAIADIKKQIRRAIQIPLYNAVIAAGYVDGGGNPFIKWKGVPFERDNLLNYFDVEISFSDVVIHEIGPNPMMEGKGVITVNCHSPLNLGEDGNDLLAAVVAAAYPYGPTPAFEGFAVNIDKMLPGSYGIDGPWLTGLVSVDWNIYRRT